MKTGFAAAAMFSLLAAGAPALADDDRGWRSDRHEWKHDRRDWRDDRRDRSRAYAEGYRDGIRAENRRDRQAWNRNYDGRYAYGNGGYGWSNDGWRYQNTPAYRSTSARNAPYWWGSNGQLQCRRQDGTTGLVVGALAGGTLGNLIAREGDKRLGSVIGGTLGAVLGNELAKGNVRCR